MIIKTPLYTHEIILPEKKKIIDKQISEAQKPSNAKYTNFYLLPKYTKFNKPIIIISRWLHGYP